MTLSTLFNYPLIDYTLIYIIFNRLYPLIDYDLIYII